MTIEVKADGVAPNYDSIISDCRTLYLAGKYDETAVRAQDAINLDFARPEGYYFCAVSEYHKNLIDLADNCIQKAVQNITANTAPDIQNSIRTAATTISNKKQFDMHIATANSAVASGYKAKAAREYTAAWQLMPTTSVEIGLKAAQLWQQLKEWLECAKIVNVLASYDELTLPTQAKAIQDSRALQTALKSTFDPMAVEKIKLACSSSDLQTKVNLIADAVILSPRNGEALFYHAWLLFAQGKTDEGFDSLLKATLQGGLSYDQLLRFSNTDGKPVFAGKILNFDTVISVTQNIRDRYEQFFGDVFGPAAQAAASARLSMLISNVIIDVQAGGFHTCALDGFGMTCWGKNSDDQTNVPLLNHLRAFSLGENHSCALDDSGVKCWGANDLGQTNIPPLYHPRAISAGSYHNCALDDSGVKCWGNNGNGQISVPPLNHPWKISTGVWHSCALDDSGVKCWGANDLGQTIIPILNHPRAISAGQRHTCALDDSGAKCWGDNRYGQTNAPTLNHPRAISTGQRHTCALDDSGVKCWGANDLGQTNIPTLNHPRGISAGLYHTCVLDDSGVKCWGANDLGQTNVPQEFQR